MCRENKNEGNKTDTKLNSDEKTIKRKDTPLVFF